MSLLINGRRSSVPAIHAIGRFTFRDQQTVADIFIFDDADYPVLLRFAVGGAAFQMIRVDLPQSGKPSIAKTIEAELAAKCRAEIPGICFEFASADLRPESDAALRDVARTVAAHADWKLSFEGHTDAVGNAAANLALSQRRADAVRLALTARYRVPAARVAATGLGQTTPKESNATLEGRARNRRVEIARTCQGATK